MENADYLMASGIAGSLDDAFRGATTKPGPMAPSRLGG
jgi:hypothetical protein